VSISNDFEHTVEEIFAFFFLIALLLKIEGGREAIFVPPSPGRSRNSGIVVELGFIRYR